MVERVSRYRAWRRRWPERFDRPLVRVAAWMQTMFLDHGLLRPLWNRPEHFALGAWRSNQPSPRQLKRLAKQGVKTVINLRGRGNNGAWLFEREACRRHGLTLIDLRMSSRGAPKVEKIRQLAHLESTVEGPLLLHCKSGADRSGFAAGLYLLLSGEGDIAAAKAQLSWRYLHFRGAKTGMLYEFFCQYERAYQHQPLSLMDWVERYYDPEELTRSFEPRGFTSWLVDKVLRRE